jgi:hypothetical protein
MNWTLVRALRLRYNYSTQDSIGTETEVQILDSTGESMRMKDCVCVSSVSRFLVQVAVEGLFIKGAVVVRD